MKTSKPFSTISFNSLDFLKSKLEELKKCDKIIFYAFIYHHAENDDIIETGAKKDHLHVFIYPSETINLDTFRKEFQEIDLEHIDKPKGVLPFQKVNNFSEWYFYALHDEKYLKRKALDKKYHYSPNDIISSDPFFLRSLLDTQPLQSSIDSVLISSIIYAATHNIPFTTVLVNLSIPLSKVNAARIIYNSASEDNNKNKGNEEINEETGEITPPKSKF